MYVYDMKYFYLFTLFLTMVFPSQGKSSMFGKTEYYQCLEIDGALQEFKKYHLFWSQLVLSYIIKIKVYGTKVIVLILMKKVLLFGTGQLMNVE